MNVSPFLALAPTIAKGVVVTAATVTFDTTALPYTSARVTNIGTVAAFIQFIDTTNTTTVGVTNSQPIINNTNVVIGTGGKGALGIISPGTTTVFITLGTGGVAS